MSAVEIIVLAPFVLAEVYCLVKASRFIALLLERMANRLEDEQAWRREWRSGAGWTKPTERPAPAAEAERRAQQNSPKP